MRDICFVEDSGSTMDEADFALQVMLDEHAAHAFKSAGNRLELCWKIQIKVVDEEVGGEDLLGLPELGSR